MKRSRGTELRVGIFVVVALIIGGTLAFVIGSQRNIFSSKTEYHAIFNDVSGLRPGNNVTVAGVSVGTIERVQFMDDGRVRVSFQVVATATELIRGDPNAEVPDGTDPDAPMPSLASIGSQSIMTGDKLIQITVGDDSFPEWPASQGLLVDRSPGIMEVVSALGPKADRIMENVRLATDPLRDQELANDLKTVADNLARITGMLATGDGVVQRLLTDPNTADEVDDAIRSLRRTSDELARTTRSVRQITDEIRTGDGTAHALIYGQDGAQALANIGSASGEVAQLLHDVRTGDGTVHDLIYEDNADQLLANLTQVSEDAAAITGDIRAGRGTIGGLLTDPSIYEDVKRLVGDLQRNDILRALVRYSIRRDEAAEAAEAEER